MMERYIVKKLNQPVDWQVTVPGSKSMTNRALLMAALSNQKVTLDGVLFSEDSRCFLDSLQSLGFDVKIEEKEKRVEIVGCNREIPKKKAAVYVGSAGTAARFLTAMLGFSNGTYRIDASGQMKKRPMKPLFDLLVSLGVQITYLEEAGFLPIEIHGRTPDKKLEVELDISKSTQFLSAVLLVSPMIKKGLRIHITSEKTDGSYIRITRKMMEAAGVEASFDGVHYEVSKDSAYQKAHYIIEPDMSAACYFYGAAAITGGKALVRNVHLDNSQGDLKFLKVLEQMGCQVLDTDRGVCVCGPKPGELAGIDINMNDFSDQTMTLAAIAPYANDCVRITGIGHIRLQESDRIHGIVTELTKLGVVCKEEADAITIYPGEVKPGIVETYEDHRMAMAFSLLGLRTEGIVIDNPLCCKKTFEEYFLVLDELTAEML